VKITGRQETVSTGHQWSKRNKSGLTDVGGPFKTTASYIATGGQKPQMCEMTVKDGSWTYNYKGHFIPYLPPVTGGSYFPPDPASSDAELNKAGASAIAACKPTNSVADVSTFLGELMREGLPKLVGSTTWASKTDSALRASSDEYLNASFGWIPIVRDIENFAYAVRHADKVLKQYERDAGKVVRRRYQFPSQTDTSETTVAVGVRSYTPIGINLGFYADPKGNVVRVRETRRDRWFSGAFTYHLPADYDSRLALARLASRADMLLGTDLDPETIWNLTPWSWAVDWFSNTGDVISNLQSFAGQGLVLRYGYMMEHSITTDTYTISHSGYKDPTAGRLPLRLVTETKKRVKANPFGFGVTWNALSAFQTSILAALGISRSGR